MNVAVIGTGYVGLVAGACLAETGNRVICADIDQSKIDGLKSGLIPLYEPGLEPIVVRNLREGRLTFTTDVAEAVHASEVIFIAVGTPPGEDGSADLQHVLGVARQIGRAMKGRKLVVTRSTVPVGTAAKVEAEIRSLTEHELHIASSPEFLKEGAAVADFMKPDRVVVGVESTWAREKLGELFEPFVRTGNPILYMDVRSAEITKYAANALLASRISFMNSMAALCDAAGADVDAVRAGVGSDARIGSSFLFPGVGYGGSCLPKDVRALIRTCEEFGVGHELLDGVEAVNSRQKRFVLDRVLARFGPDLSGKTFAVWGLAFKPNTDDMREAPSLVTIEGLLRAGARVAAHDPAAMDEARKVLGERVELRESNYEVLEGADALLIHTEWQPYRQPDFERIRNSLHSPVIIDGRNLYRPARMRDLGFQYESVGRPKI